MSRSFMGYPRTAGRPGIRNHLTIVSICGLNAPGARKIAAALPGAVLVSNPYGRGQVGADREFQARALTALACHPNSGAVIVLAPDSAARQRYQDAAEGAGRAVAGFSLQEADEDSPALVAAAIATGRDLQADLERIPRAACPLSDLVVAMECGHSDASSGMVANPLAGELADAVIADGGSVVISETVEWLGTEPALAARCPEPAVAARLLDLVAARHAIATAAGSDPYRGNPGPQNIEGGITTLEEKSLGAIAKGGTTPILGALAEGEAIPGAGLFLMDTPALSPESITSMVAGGAQAVCFTTGHGNPYGSAMAPTLKITANPETARRLPDQIDFDASPAFTGARSRAELLPELLDLLVRTCDGASTACERQDEGFEVISRLGPSI
ncbi:UxaA family hydrolase [Sulfitobacter sp. D35]|uniref:UxaA family hydrolase n=1 Tax=Sulfitobacter sp. D35 TaxID=3083252 RepID=UPI00296F7700|nr:UxaA family hydrolase [Sulfitobacter sp. D35]MDW4497210.1 UxaA family hydrolase [Sulfitobacter sp. D35]